MSVHASELRDFYRGKRVLVTGHMGFMGSWLTLWLIDLGAEMYGYSLPLTSTPQLFEECKIASRLAKHQVADLRDYAALQEFVDRARPEILFHLAAQPLVTASYRVPRDTYEINVMGTVNVLEAIREFGCTRVVQIVTSDKCYAIDEKSQPHREDDRLGGADPYSSSKACAELVVEAYRKSFFTSSQTTCSLASARVGNVIGGGDWAHDRLVPDCIRALQVGANIEVRNPQAVRPWQHVLEACAGYLLLAMRQWHVPQSFADAFNFGPAAAEHWSVERLVTEIVTLWGAGSWHESTGQGAAPVPETHALRLDSGRARSLVGWRPVYTCARAVAETIAWYRDRRDRGTSFDAAAKCLGQIRAYQAERDANSSQSKP